MNSHRTLVARLNGNKTMSTTKTGENNEQRFVELRQSQGYLSFKRNRKPYGPYDMWKTFDVISINSDGIELCQVKTAKRKDTRGALTQVAKWMIENKDKLPDNLSCVVAVWIEAEQKFYVTEVG